MNDRIKLATAMGWKSGRTDTVAVMGRPISHTRWIDPDGNDRAQCPDPFTDANDDYAVLEWMRNTSDSWSKFESALTLHAGDPFVWCYKIGDYARAALKVINDD